MKFCEECGAQLEDDAVFCEECGATIEHVEIPPNETPEPILAEVPTKGNSKKTNKKFLLIGIVATIVVLSTGVIGLAAIIGKHKNNNPSNETGSNVAVVTTTQESKEQETTIKETVTEETTTEVATQETTTEVVEETTETQKIEYSKEGTIFNGINHEEIRFWWYQAEFEGDLVLIIHEDSSGMGMQLYKKGGGDDFYSVVYDVSSWYYETEYQYNGAGFGRENEYNCELNMKIHKDGIDIKWIAQEGDSSKVLYDGFYALQNISWQLSSDFWDSDSLHKNDILAEVNYPSEYLNKHIENGVLSAVSYLVYDTNTNMNFTVSKNNMDDFIRVQLAVNGYDIDFVSETPIYYNEEVEFLVKNNTGNYSEVQYTRDENGQKIYELKDDENYEKIKFTFTEDNVLIYLSSCNITGEKLIYSQIVMEEGVKKGITVMKY